MARGRGWAAPPVALVQPSACPHLPAEIQTPRHLGPEAALLPGHRSSLRLELVLEGALLLPTVLLVRGPVLLLALGATVARHLAAPTDVELPELKGHTGHAGESAVGHRLREDPATPALGGRAWAPVRRRQRDSHHSREAAKGQL